MHYVRTLLAYCDMRTLYLRNVPEEVGSRLDELARREGMSTSAFVVRELGALARRADNRELLAGLPDLGVDSESVVETTDEARSAR